MSYYDLLYSYLPFLLSTTTTNNNETKTVNYPTTPYQNANYLSSNSLSQHDKQYRRTTATAARYTDKYNCTSATYQQRSIGIQSTTPSIHTQITIKTSNTTSNYLNSPNNNTVNFMNNKPNYFNNSNDNTVTFMNNTPNYYNNRPLEEQLLRPEIDESSLSSKSSCTTHSSFQVRLVLYIAIRFAFLTTGFIVVLCRGSFRWLKVEI